MNSNERQLIQGKLRSLESTLWKIPTPTTEYQALVASCNDPNIPVYQLEQRVKRLEEMSGLWHKPLDAWPKTAHQYLLPFGLPDFVPKIIRRHPWAHQEMSVFML